VDVGLRTNLVLTRTSVLVYTTEEGALPYADANCLDVPIRTQLRNASAENSYDIGCKEKIKLKIP
jgi:hypothetical protein